MNHLIRVEQKDGKQSVMARELYRFLGFDDANWKRWYNKNIVHNEFAVKDLDWTPYAFVASYGIKENDPFFPMTNCANKGLMATAANPRPTQDFIITLDFAKRLAMMARTEKGEEARQYFIACEQALQERQPLALDLPKDYLSALKKLVESEEEKLQLQAALNEAQPKADFYDQVVDSKDALSMNAAAKLLNIPNLGRNKLFDFLREQKVLMDTNTPYQSYVNLGWFRVVQNQWQSSDGNVHIQLQTLVYQRGIDGIRRLWERTNPPKRQLCTVHAEPLFDQ